MAIYANALQSSSITINQVAWELRTSSVNSPRLMELTMTTLGVSSGHGLIFATTRGLTPTLSAFQPEDPADPPAQTNAAVAWVTLPQVAPDALTKFLRRTNIAANGGEGFIWTFPFGLKVPVDSSLCLYNTGLNNTIAVNAVIDE